MNIHDYILEKIANSKRITDSLIPSFKSSKKILGASNDEIAKILYQTKLSDETIKNFLENKEKFNKNEGEFIAVNEKETENIMNAYGLKIVSYSDKEYPLQLKNIKEIPLNLYVLGNLDFDFSKSIAIVGTRKLTTYATQKIREIAEDLAKKKFCIISGLARGADKEAHTSTLLAHGKTIAVLPFIDPIYPSENEPLAKEILENGGAIISENLKRVYDPSLFTQRNRIISGLSKGVFIVEGSEKSGSLSQYNHAKRQGKIIFSLKPIKSHEGDYLPRLIFSEQKNWVLSAEDAIKILEESKGYQKTIFL